MPPAGCATTLQSVVLAEQPGSHLYHPRGGPERWPGERDWEPAHVYYPPGWGLTGGSWGQLLSTRSHGPPGAPGHKRAARRHLESSKAQHGAGLGHPPRLGAAVTCHPFLALPAQLCVPRLAWLPTWHPSVSLGVPVSGCPLVCLPPGQYPHVWVRLTVFLCLSVLCSWTLLRMEWYEFFVSSAHPGPSLPQVRGPEFSPQHCSGRQARRDHSLSLCRLSWPVSPQPVELWADTGPVRAAEY